MHIVVTCIPTKGLAQQKACYPNPGGSYALVGIDLHKRCVTWCDPQSWPNYSGTPELLMVARRLSWRVVSSAKNLSTWLSYDAEVGRKWKRTQLVRTQPLDGSILMH